MSRLGLPALVLFAAFLPPRAEAQQFWEDDYDAYATGAPIAGQGGWETFNNIPAADAIVTSAQALSPPNALRISGPANVIRPFGSGAPTGDLYVKLFIPSNQTGEVWLRIPNTYSPGGAVNWSV